MEVSVSRIWSLLDAVAIASLAPLSSWILLSGIDDLFLDFVCLAAWLRQRLAGRVPAQGAETASVPSTPQKRIAIFLPCWKEDAVITQMVETNLGRIEYANYDFFIGVYPNDQPTLEAARALDIRHRQVHMAVCPHDGPTSKADCLNWIYHRMMEYEAAHHSRYEVVITHDAEDVIHPQSLHWINYHIDSHDMVQVPVLPLPTPWTDWTHGVYCDEFAEFQTKDMPGRQILNGFIPSCGVGTGFSRWGLEKLAEDRGRIFQPECLTEDYENGIRLHLMKCSQLFMPLLFQSGEPVATREYFPRNLPAAVRQRTRWVTGIALQTWERHGWAGGLGTKYWLWRDRKGLVGNPVSFLTSLIFCWGAITLAASQASGAVWGIGRAAADPVLAGLMASTMLLQLVHTGVRTWCTARVYGWRFAAWAPLRTLTGNYINFRATLGAIGRYAAARWRRRPLVWLKTDHTYPFAPQTSRPLTLNEVLIASKLVADGDLARAEETKPDDQKLEDFLLAGGWLSEEQLYGALSVAARLPLARVEPWRVRRHVARAFPQHIVDRWRVLPFRVAGGYLWVASAAAPEAELREQIEKLTRLPVRFQLVTPSNFEMLRQELLS